MSWIVCLWQAFSEKSNVESKARAYPSEEPLRYSTLGYAPGLQTTLGYAPDLQTLD
jgi:hypothetical protein